MQQQHDNLLLSQERLKLCYSFLNHLIIWNIGSVDFSSLERKIVDEALYL